MMQEASATVPEQVFSDAFAAFYRSEYDSATRFAYLLCGSRAIADDLVQDSFLAIATRFQSLVFPQAYLRRTIVRHASSLHRLEHRRGQRLHRLYVPGDLTSSARELADVLSQLPIRQRSALVLRYWYGMNNSEVASTLGCRVGTVKSLISRGLALLRIALENS